MLQFPLTGNGGVDIGIDSFWPQYGMEVKYEMGEKELSLYVLLVSPLNSRNQASPIVSTIYVLFGRLLVFYVC